MTLRIHTPFPHIFIIIILITSAGCVASPDQGFESADGTIWPCSSEQAVRYQPIGIWHYQGYDPFLGPFEEFIELKSIGTFRSKISAPEFDPQPIIIRGYWKRTSSIVIELTVSTIPINEIRFDQYDGTFVNSDGYQYTMILYGDQQVSPSITAFKELI